MGETGEWSPYGMLKMNIGFSGCDDVSWAEQGSGQLERVPKC